MILVAYLNGEFFRSQSVNESEIDRVKTAMLEDDDRLKFEVLTEQEFRSSVKDEPTEKTPTDKERIEALEMALLEMVMGGDE